MFLDNTTQDDIGTYIFSLFLHLFVHLGFLIVYLEKSTRYQHNPNIVLIVHTKEQVTLVKFGRFDQTFM